MKVLISVSAATPTAAELKRKIKHTDAYAKLKAVVTRAHQAYSKRKAAYEKAAVAKKKAMKESLAKLKADWTKAKSKASEYKEKNGKFISRTEVTTLKKQLQDLESGKSKAGSKKVSVKKKISEVSERPGPTVKSPKLDKASNTKASPKVASIRSKISRLNSELRAARGKSAPSKIYAIREKLDAAREELKKAGGIKTTSGKDLLERSGKKVGAKTPRRPKTIISPELKPAKTPVDKEKVAKLQEELKGLQAQLRGAKKRVGGKVPGDIGRLRNIIAKKREDIAAAKGKSTKKAAPKAPTVEDPKVSAIDSKIAAKQLALQKAQDDLKSVRGNGPGDDRNKTLNRSKINDIKEEIKKLKLDRAAVKKTAKK